MAEEASVIEQEAPAPATDPAEPNEPKEPNAQGESEAVGASGDGTSEGESLEKKGTPEAPKTVSLNGKEVPLAQVEKTYQQAAQVAAMFKQAQELLGQAEATPQRLVKDPASVMAEAFQKVYGVDPQRALAEVNKWAQERALAIWQWENMPEADRKALQQQQELETIKAELEARRRKDEESSFEAEKTKAHAALEKEIVPALTEAGLNPDPKGEHMGYVAQVMKSTRLAGHEVSAQEAASLVKAELEKRDEERLKAMPLDRLKGLRPDFLQHVREGDLAEVKAKRSVPQQRSTPAAEPAKGKSRLISASKWGKS